MGLVANCRIGGTSVTTGITTTDAHDVAHYLHVEDSNRVQISRFNPRLKGDEILAPRRSPLIYLLLQTRRLNPELI